MKESDCTFEPFGCTFVGNVSCLESHHKNFYPQHIEMLAKFIAENINPEVIKTLTLKIQEQKESNKKTFNNYKALNKYIASNITDKIMAIESNVKELNTKINSNSRDSTRKEIDNLNKEMSNINLHVADMNIKMESNKLHSANGVLLWRIDNYFKKKQDAQTRRKLCLYSPPFSTSEHGYQMCAQVYLNGDGMGKGTHISIFFKILKSPFDPLLSWPFKQKVTLMILDQKFMQHHITESFRPDPDSSSFKRPVSDSNIGSGCPLFSSHENIEVGEKFIVEDTLFIKIIVDTHNIRNP